MSTVATPAPSKSIAVTAIGLITMLSGLAHAILGGSLIFGGAGMADEPAGRGGPILGILGGMLALLGVAFLLQGAPMMLAGSGVLLRKQWGRILTFIMAGLAIPWGLASLGAYDKGAGYLVYGAVQLLYSILAFVILARNGAEFSRPRV